MATACQAANIEFIPATELTAEFKGTELHIIGYGIDIEHARLLGEMKHFQDVRQNRIKEMVERLNRMNIPLREETVNAIANCNSPGRPHIARALIQINVCKTLDEAFERFLKKGRPAWVPKFKISANDAIALIHEAGGLAVLAHPGLVHHDALIPELVAAQLDGIECYHTKHPTTTVEHYLEIAEEHSLLVTGGSDCHGMNKGQPLIGSIKLPYQHVEQLKQRLPASNPYRQPFVRTAAS
jgi:predicted metal-dependent phosphoesterase TrpH